MRLVLDASMALAWCLQDEDRPTIAPIRQAVIRDGCHVPALWISEFANALLVAERRKRLAAGELEIAWGLLAGINISVDPADRNTLVAAVVPLARDHNLTVYDACYLELAIRLSLGLATLDSRLIEAARKRGVGVTTA